MHTFIYVALDRDVYRILEKNVLTSLQHGHFQHRQVRLPVLSTEPLHWNQ